MEHGAWSLLYKNMEQYFFRRQFLLNSFLPIRTLAAAYCVKKYGYRDLILIYRSILLGQYVVKMGKIFFIVVDM